MTKKEYMSQFDNMDDYMEAVQRDYQEEIGEPMTFEMRFLPIRLGLNTMSQKDMREFFATKIDYMFKQGLR